MAARAFPRALQDVSCFPGRAMPGPVIDQGDTRPWTDHHEKIAYSPTLRPKPSLLFLLPALLHHVGPCLSLWVPGHGIQIETLSIPGCLFQLRHALSEI